MPSSAAVMDRLPPERVISSATAPRRAVRIETSPAERVSCWVVMAVSPPEMVTRLPDSLVLPTE